MEICCNPQLFFCYLYVTQIFLCHKGLISKVLQVKNFGQVTLNPR